MKKMMRCSLAVCMAVLLLSACATKTAQEPTAPDLPDDLDAYLKQTEARFTDLRPNNEKLIVWADPSKKAKTPLSIIYLHGFSACRLEVAPLCDIVAHDLGANLFYTRLSGHGRSLVPPDRRVRRLAPEKPADRRRRLPSRSRRKSLFRSPDDARGTDRFPPMRCGRPSAVGSDRRRC